MGFGFDVVALNSGFYYLDCLVVYIWFWVLGVVVRIGFWGCLWVW